MKNFAMVKSEGFRTTPIYLLFIHSMISVLCHSYGQRSRQWTTSHISAQRSTPSAVIRMWTQALKALRVAARHRLKSPRVALTFVVGPAALTLTARLYGTVAYCSADLNNNHLPATSQAQEKIPEFSWALLWEFVRPQILALIGAIIVRHICVIINPMRNNI